MSVPGALREKSGLNNRRALCTPIKSGDCITLDKPRVSSQQAPSAGTECPSQEFRAIYQGITGSCSGQGEPWAPTRGGERGQGEGALGRAGGLKDEPFQAGEDKHRSAGSQGGWRRGGGSEGFWVMRAFQGKKWGARHPLTGSVQKPQKGSNGLGRALQAMGIQRMFRILVVQSSTANDNPS